MKDLPLEVLGEIFLHLHQNDKLECMLVCRHWKRILENSFLYHTFCIFSSNGLKWLTKKVQDTPAAASKVERLVICYEDSEVDLSTLLPLLPKINTIFCHIGDFNNLILNNVSQFPWSKHIKHIDDSALRSIAFHLLLTNYCPNLTTLTITDWSQNIIPLLKNAPALKSLSLGCGIVHLHDLERIHQSAPNIQSLTIHSLSLDIVDLGKTIDPATSVTECIFTNMKVRIFKMRIDLLVYIYKKYPNLSKLIYNVRDGEATDEDIDKFNTCGWAPLFQRFGPQLKTFGVYDGDCIKDLFSQLDKHCFQVRNLKLWILPKAQLTELAQSQQVHYIQTLVLNDMRIKNFEWLKELQQLKKFKLCYSGYSYSGMLDIELADILEDAPSSLRSLSFHHLNLETDNDYIDVSNIETLSFYMVKLPVNMDNYISRHFPKLSVLKLKNCRQNGHIYSLPELNLISFCFTEYFQNQNTNIVISTRHNNERRCYSVKSVSYGMSLIKESKPFIPPLKSLPANENHRNLLFSLYCNSLKYVSFK